MIEEKNVSLSDARGEQKHINFIIYSPRRGLSLEMWSSMKKITGYEVVMIKIS